MERFSGFSRFRIAAGKGGGVRTEQLKKKLTQSLLRGGQMADMTRETAEGLVSWVIDGAVGYAKNRGVNNAESEIPAELVQEFFRNPLDEILDEMMAAKPDLGELETGPYWRDEPTPQKMHPRVPGAPAPPPVPGPSAGSKALEGREHMLELFKQYPSMKERMEKEVDDLLGQVITPSQVETQEMDITELQEGRRASLRRILSQIQHLS